VFFLHQVVDVGDRIVVEPLYQDCEEVLERCLNFHKNGDQ
jgi:hypothetical protein